MYRPAVFIVFSSFISPILPSMLIVFELVPVLRGSNLDKYQERALCCHTIESDQFLPHQVPFSPLVCHLLYVV